MWVAAERVVDAPLQRGLVLVQLAVHLLGGQDRNGHPWSLGRLGLFRHRIAWFRCAPRGLWGGGGVQALRLRLRLPLLLRGRGRERDPEHDGSGGQADQAQEHHERASTRGQGALEQGRAALQDGRRHLLLRAVWRGTGFLALGNLAGCPGRNIQGAVLLGAPAGRLARVSGVRGRSRSCRRRRLALGARGPSAPLFSRSSRASRVTGPVCLPRSIAYKMGPSRGTTGPGKCSFWVGGAPFCSASSALEARRARSSRSLSIARVLSSSVAGRSGSGPGRGTRRTGPGADAGTTTRRGEEFERAGSARAIFAPHRLQRTIS